MPLILKSDNVGSSIICTVSLFIVKRSRRMGWGTPTNLLILGNAGISC